MQKPSDFKILPGSSKQDDTISNHTAALPSAWTRAFAPGLYFSPDKGLCSMDRKKEIWNKLNIYLSKISRLLGLELNWRLFYSCQQPSGGWIGR